MKNIFTASDFAKVADIEPSEARQILCNLVVARWLIGYTLVPEGSAPDGSAVIVVFSVAKREE